MTEAVRRVAVLGTGVLGSQIAFQTAYKGFEVTAWDISEEALSAARRSFETLVGRYETDLEGAADGPAREALDRISLTTDLVEAAGNTDLVIEAVPESLDIKREVYGKLAAAAPERTIFVTNSSTLLPSDMAAATGRPDRFLALHFANQIWIRNTAEVMGHPATDPDVYARVVQFARDIGMEPIELKKEQPGYVLNSLLVPFLRAAEQLLVDGIAEPEMVDRTWRIATGAPNGPFEILDVVGLTTAYNIAVASDDPGNRRIARFLKENYIDQGKLGRATGEGFYRY